MERTKERMTRPLRVREDKRNVGGWERKARLGGGAASAAAALLVPIPWLQLVLGLGAVSGLVTGLTRYCPMNQLAGRDTYHP